MTLNNFGTLISNALSNHGQIYHIGIRWYGVYK